MKSGVFFNLRILESLHGNPFRNLKDIGSSYKQAIFSTGFLKLGNTLFFIVTLMLVHGKSA